jgi:hypothetical protein
MPRCGGSIDQALKGPEVTDEDCDLWRDEPDGTSRGDHALADGHEVTAFVRSPEKGDYKLGYNVSPSLKASRADVAAAMLGQLTDDTYVGRASIIST